MTNAVWLPGTASSERGSATRSANISPEDQTNAKSTLKTSLKCATSKRIKTNKSTPVEAKPLAKKPRKNQRKRFAPAPELMTEFASDNQKECSLVTSLPEPGDRDFEHSSGLATFLLFIAPHQIVS